MPHTAEMIDINLDSPRTPDPQLVPFKKCITFDKHVDSVEYEVEDEDEDQDQIDYLLPKSQKLRSWSSKPNEDDGKPHLRYFNVGPSTYQIRCPLCKQRADTETVKMTGALGQLSCLLSTLSCCFPIFSLSFVYLCLQSRLKSKRMFCNKCGGHLGFYWRPT